MVVHASQKSNGTDEIEKEDLSLNSIGNNSGSYEVQQLLVTLTVQAHNISKLEKLLEPILLPPSQHGFTGSADVSTYAWT